MEQNTKGPSEKRINNTVPDRGTNYLLAIAINDYQHYTKLSNTVRDLEAFIELITTRYHFDPAHVTFIRDVEATKTRIESAFDDLIDIVKPQDNLIVYFSGHGRHNENRGGFWIPVDAGKGDKAWTEYLSNDIIKSYLSKIKSFHTFLIADSCFSGSLFIDKSKERFTGDRRDTEPSRWGLTSGKKEIVSDGHPGTHSPFATALLDVLRKADQPLGVMRICDLVLEKVAANAEQTPMGSPLQVPGHQGGQMVFYFREDEEGDWQSMKDSEEGCAEYLVKYPDGKYAVIAKELIPAYSILRGDKQQEYKAWEHALTTNTIEVFIDFYYEYPRSKYSNLALDKLEELELIKNKWDSVIKTRQSTLLRYIQQNPQSPHLKEAEQLLDALRESAAIDPPKEKEGIEAFPESKPENHDDQVEENEPEQNFKWKWVVGPILGLLLVLMLGNKIVGLFSKPDKELRAKFSNSMVLIPAGEFQMGSNSGETNGKPVHKVSLDHFYLGKTEVTQEQWRAVMGSDPPELRFKGCDQCPVENVSWNDVQKFIKKLNAKTGEHYRLPTEAEWEYAARGGENQTYAYAGSDTLNEVGWYSENSDGKTHLVGQKKPNELGLYDMSGNVWEWCQDWYVSDYYSKSPSDNPQGPTTGSGRVFRGGSWFVDPALVHVGNRLLFTPVFPFHDIGFRLARGQ